jgi:hypothetical protein
VCVCVCVCVGEVVSLVCSYVATDDSNKPKGSIQWVPASSAVSAEVRWYNHLFTTEEPNDDTWEAELNADSEIVMKSALVSEGLVLKCGMAVRNEQYHNLDSCKAGQ